METDRHYFLEGLFVIVLAAGLALFFVWLAKSGRSDDVIYRIHFDESVSGLTTGDPVKFRGVEVGRVKSMEIDPADPRLVQVDVSLRKDTPVKTDTHASLVLKGITGVVFVELNGGSVGAQALVAATPPGEIPEIRSEKSKLATVLDELPRVIAKFSSIENQARKVLTDVGETTGEIKADPSVLLKGPKEARSKGANATPTTPIARQ
jgi:phospholipid/cholesterol/gamma-HCH transport system substrate-binding protein